MKDSQRIFFILTSHDRKGDTGQPTGFYLSEVTHPHKVLAESATGVGQAMVELLRQP